ncbi:hypothetical protein V5O48_008973 [Marasmius crinis-equi]|uniref:Protein kinase domain-containing protein n=1 Tax=Marasmius crinis-equi TaxID=585013 RepID=A0ABR3FD19_9AGAR
MAGDRCVCLKVLRVHIQKDENKRKRMVGNFCQEALIWWQLEHPNLLQLLGVNTELFKGDFCLVSPWMKNGDIITYLEKHPDHDKQRSLREIAAGLEYLHSRSPMIVHGDIRGANILVDDECNCRLADFGLSREFSGTTMEASSSGGPKGAVRWMAPEMFDTLGRKDSNEDRSPADIYAYACTVVEIITGRPPFSDLFDGAVIAQVILHCARPERPTGVWCPDNIWKLVEKCWDTNRLKRPTARYIHTYLSGSIETLKAAPKARPDSFVSTIKNDSVSQRRTYATRSRTLPATPLLAQYPTIPAASTSCQSITFSSSRPLPSPPTPRSQSQQGYPLQATFATVSNQPSQSAPRLHTSRTGMEHIPSSTSSVQQLQPLLLNRSVESFDSNWTRASDTTVCTLGGLYDRAPFGLSQNTLLNTFEERVDDDKVYGDLHDAPNKEGTGKYLEKLQDDNGITKGLGAFEAASRNPDEDHGNLLLSPVRYSREKTPDTDPLRAAKQKGRAEKKRKWKVVVDFVYRKVSS